jgi:hypothetical protein
MLLPLAAGAGDSLPTDLLQSSADPARAAQLTPLQETQLGAAAKEVRIWIGFYNMAELKLVRFQVDDAGQVQGESFFIYPPMAAAAEQPYYDLIAGQCRAFNRTQDWEACRSDKAAAVHWDSAYKALQSLGLWQPDASKLPPPGPKGGPTVLVELRSGDSYQAYAFNDPGADKSPRGQQAAKLIAIVDGLVGVSTDQAPEEMEDRD